MTLYHNTSNANAIKIHKEGIKGGMRLQAYGKGSEAEGAGIWCTAVRGYGYGGATITFEIDENDEELFRQNDTEYIVYRDIRPEEITDIDLMVSTIRCNEDRTDSMNTTVESDIPNAIKTYGKEKVLKVFKQCEDNIVEPYTYDKLVNLVETGNKLLKGTISLTESKKIVEDIDGKESIIEEINRIVDTCKKYNITKELRKYTIPIMRDYQLRYNPTADSRKSPWIYLVNEINSINNEIDSTLGDFIDGFIREGNQCIIDNTKTESKKLEEASRNELLAKSKAETITRYNKSAGYKGFSLVDIDTTAIKTRDAIIITNRVGDYFDTVELDDILYWVGLEVDEARDKKMTLETVRRALLGAMDGMNIKVDCNCGDFVYRFAYMASVLEYKYGKPENRPSNITNPNGYGAMCKHLISLLSNKSWVKQVATTLQQWIVDEIDWVRDFLKVTEEDFQLPDEYARQLGKHGAMKKFWDKTPDNEEDTDEQEDDTEETNKDGDTDNKNNEATNDTPEESNLNNQTNMPKAFRDNKSDEELEEK